MSKFENFQTIDRNVDQEKRVQLVEKYRVKLKENLKDESELLREEGFPVDDLCRININQLVGKNPKYAYQFVQLANTNLARLENKFKKAKGSNQKVKEAHDVGELLEIAKTLLFNQDLFWGALKSCSYLKIG